MLKKILALVICALLLSSSALAGDLGVQLIGTEQTAAIPISLDDMQLETAYSIDGYAMIVPKEAKFVQCFAQFGDKGDYSTGIKYSNNGAEESVWTVYSHSASKLLNSSYRYFDAAWMDSGDSADFFWLLMDVTNMQKTAVEYTEEISVKVVYQDEYEFVGWVRQIVYDHMEGVNGDKGLSRYDYEKEDYPNEIVMNPAKVEAIDMLYTGTYAFGCTLPNFVVEDKDSPLRIEIKLGENDLTYHIRKEK